jgi:hypothetical protein
VGTVVATASVGTALARGVVVGAAVEGLDAVGLWVGFGVGFLVGLFVGFFVGVVVGAAVEGVATAAPVQLTVSGRAGL